MELIKRIREVTQNLEEDVNQFLKELSESYRKEVITQGNNFGNEFEWYASRYEISRLFDQENKDQIVIYHNKVWCHKCPCGEENNRIRMGKVCEEKVKELAENAEEMRRGLTGVGQGLYMCLLGLGSELATHSKNDGENRAIYDSKQIPYERGVKIVRGIRNIPVD